LRPLMVTAAKGSLGDVKKTLGETANDVGTSKPNVPCIRR